MLPAAELAARGAALAPGSLAWPGAAAPGRGAAWPVAAAQAAARPLDAAKFRDPGLTAKGEARATVALAGARRRCGSTPARSATSPAPIATSSSSPRNDRLSYLTAAEMRDYLDEIARDGLPTEEIGFTGGEPFMYPDILAMLEECLGRGFRVLVLTNAMRPMRRLDAPLLELRRRLGARLTLRVSLDHYTRALHEEERGEDTWRPTFDGLKWLLANGFTTTVAGRTLWGEPDCAMRQGFARLFAEHGLAIDAEDREQLSIFPEMDAAADVPETTRLLGHPPCRSRRGDGASSRMVVKHRDATGRASSPARCCPMICVSILDRRWPMPPAASLNHPHCAKFCVLGGGACSRA